MNLGFIARLLAGGIVASQALAYAVSSPETLIRPPGAQDEDDFLARCIRCGKCIEACPYETIHVNKDMVDVSSGTPCITVREKACRMCEDIPCANACPSGALRDVETREDIAMGTAVINELTCLSYKGMRCEVCYRACPLIDRAITIDYRMRDGDDLHSVFAPIIDSDVCTGCGWCVERCVLDDPAIGVARKHEDVEAFWSNYNEQHGLSSDGDPSRWSRATDATDVAHAFPS